MDHAVLPFGPIGYPLLVPIIQGIAYSFLGATSGGAAASSGTVLTIDISSGALNIVEVNANAGSGALPQLGGPQFFQESGPSISYWSGGGNDGLGPDWYTLFFNSFSPATTPLSVVLTDIMGQVGVPADQINTTTWFNDAPVEGYAVDNVTSARKVIEDLAQVFMFDVTESDNILKVVSRGQNPVATVTQSQLGIVGKGPGPSLTDAEASNHFYEETRTQEIDLPQRVDISFVDPAREYEAGTTGYSRPSSPFPSMQSNALMQVNLPIALSEQTAQQWAETICYAAWIERINHKFLVPPEFLQYDPTDVLFFSMDDGLTFCDRLTRIDISGDFSIALESVDQVQPYYLTPGVSPTVEDLYSPYRPVSVGFHPGSVIPAPPVPLAAAKPIIMDTPLQSDADANRLGAQVPFYWGAGAYSPGFTNGVLSTAENGGPLTPDGITNVDIPWGSAQTIVPPPPEGAFATDKTSQVVLSPEMDYEAAGTYNWESLTDAEWPSEANMILIGQEIICFKNVTVNADKTVTISTLLRGWRGTEDFASDHVLGERFVILGQGSDQIAGVPTTDVNQQLTANLFSTNLLQLLQPSVTITFKGNALRPYAPVGIFRSDDMSGNSTITWNRRTRYNGSLQEGSGAVPLNEDSELYRLYVCNAAPDPTTFDPTNVADYVREVDGLTTASYVYSAANQTTDGFSSLQTFWVVVYQISGEVGLGFPGVAELQTNTPVYG